MAGTSNIQQSAVFRRLADARGLLGTVLLRDLDKTSFSWESEQQRARAADVAGASTTTGQLDVAQLVTHLPSRFSELVSITRLVRREPEKRQSGLSAPCAAIRRSGVLDGLTRLRPVP
jgi:hypothetical protein